MTQINRMGRADDQEDNDTTPVAMPAGYAVPTPIQDLLAKYVREAIELERGIEHETIEEADDFEEDDDSLLDLSPYTFANIQDDYAPPLEEETPPEAPESPPPPPEVDSDDPPPSGEERPSGGS